MLTHFRIWIAIAILASAGLACQISGLAPAAQNAPASGEVLFQDDFSKPDSGWTSWQQDLSEVSYRAGGLHMLVNAPGYDYWTRPGQRFADARIEVDAAKVGGPDNNDFGLICRYRNGDNFYAFLASSDGYYGIVRMKEGKYQVLSANQLSYSDKIHKGSALNHLRADCVGSRLTFFINGESLAQVEDSAFQSGEVALLAGAYDHPGVEILFDNFIVLKP